MINPVQRRQPQPQQERSERSKQVQAEREIARAEEDYQRLRNAYLSLAREEHNEVALAMIGADMDRAHAVLQDLTGLRQLPFTHEPTRVVRREARRLVEENS
ncbi:MAG: hypothetical protein JWQ13_2123 [Ramlibacter sp.]|jgi:hypothetical protein|uniref:hypothetical protein n=1 Tax=Ramlibacter sp. TaxID=1917967 RepID=UPI00262543E5|nr:hypothetical protein [Ramlibacter sp.]MDB5749618.1 hypothetical protein [Ramlibacter sp.]MDB5942557.1 hypothetical protein [Ramlibacter sp.]